MTLLAGQRETFADGLVYVPGYFDIAAQQALLRDIETVIAAAPLFQPRMPKTGKPFSVEMTNCGPLGWVSDRDGGYRYQATHPRNRSAMAANSSVSAESLERTWRIQTRARSLPRECLRG
jgi:alkylated DNA repair protein (DNA oxidative demethylase)